MTTQLTEAGQKLADALAKVDIVYPYKDGRFYRYEDCDDDFTDKIATAAQILLTPEGGGGLTLADLHAANIARQAEWCPDQVPDLSFRGNELAGETGEACNVIKKLERERQGWRGSRATLNDLAEELADVVICADLCAVTAGIDLGTAVVAKFNATSDKVGISVRLAPRTSAPGNDAGMREGAKQIAQALRAADWSDVNIGNKVLISAAIDALSPPTGSAGDDDTGVREAALPISMAPRDGTPVIGFGAPLIRYPEDCEWRETYWRLYKEGTTAHDAFVAGKGPEGYWNWSEPQNGWGSSWEPTRFIPLPAALAPQPPKAETPAGVGVKPCADGQCRHVPDCFHASRCLKGNYPLAPTARAGDGVERVRHLKRGTEYEVLGEAEAQVSSGPLRRRWACDLDTDAGPARATGDGDRLTVYRDPKSGKLWCRFTDEFRDGRFVTLTAAPAANGGDA